MRIDSVEVPQLGYKLYKARKARVSDPRNLAVICELVGISRQDWYRLEEGQAQISLENLRRIEALLEVDLVPQSLDKGRKR